MHAALLLLLPLGQVGQGLVEPQPLADEVPDTGVNVLLDQSHQMTFFWAWDVQWRLRNTGHRVTCNQASLHHVLTPGNLALVRDQYWHNYAMPDGSSPYRPFARIPVPEYHTVITVQAMRAQEYLPEEREALRRFVADGGGLVLVGCYVPGGSPIGSLAAELGAEFTPDRASVRLTGAEPIPGLSDEVLQRQYLLATYGAGWETLVGDTDGRGVLARRSLGSGKVYLIADHALCVTVGPDGREGVNADLLAWLCSAATAKPPVTGDERRVPWEHGGIGGAYYPENEIVVDGVTVLYADNQLDHIKDAAQTGFADVRAVLQQMLPTPPSPGGETVIVLSAGDGGGWAENVFRPKVAGTISTDLNGIKSILAHELAHTMYGPEAHDGTPGCSLPAWFSEAHAGFFQRKACVGLGIAHDLYDHSGLMRRDPLLNDIDLANVRDGDMGYAWAKAWFIWLLLDSRYGEAWYPKWLAHVHRKYGNPSRALTMDEYVISISEAVGEDVAPLWERFGTTIRERTNLPPIGPR